MKQFLGKQYESYFNISSIRELLNSFPIAEQIPLTRSQIKLNKIWMHAKTFQFHRSKVILMTIELFGNPCMVFSRISLNYIKSMQHMVYPCDFIFKWRKIDWIQIRNYDCDKFSMWTKQHFGFQVWISFKERCDIVKDKIVIF